jgi:hypothetical protein
MQGMKCGWHCRVKSVLDSTEPAKYTGSYATISKVIADIEIAMHQSAGKAIITHTITIAARTIVTTMHILWLLKLTVSQEQVGGLRN